MEHSLSPISFNHLGAWHKASLGRMLSRRRGTSKGGADERVAGIGDIIYEHR